MVALGSYARREVCPASDVDLLLLHTGWGGADLEAVVRQLLYPLWDAGLRVGHAVRTPAEAVTAAGDRVDTATALVDRRLIAGDPGLLDDLAGRADRWLRRNAARILDDLTQAAAPRRGAAGRRPGVLEPHLKDGAGGLRDLHALRWAAACLLSDADLDALVNAQHLGASERHELAAAGHTLLRARCALHLATGAARRPASSAADRLRLEVQDETAALLGEGDGDALLRTVGLAMRSVAHLHDRIWPRLVEHARSGRRRPRSWRHSSRAGQQAGDGLALRDGAVLLDEDRSLHEDPALALRAVAAAGRLGAGLHRVTAERLRRHLADVGALAWDASSRAALADLLRAGARALPAWADADAIGLLPAYLPEWGHIRGRPQRNPYHTFDLDTHALQTVAELVDLGKGARAAGDADVFGGLAAPDTLLLAAFLHDVGKAWPGDHSVVGAQVAGRWTAHMGVPAADREHVERLVRHHLLLPDVATHRDLDDAGELERVAKAVVDRESVDGLFLLSLADARATGPSAHSPWKDGLVTELHRRVRSVLSDGAAAAVPTSAAVAESVRSSGGGDAVEALLAGVGDEYLAAAGPEQVLAHTRLARPEPGPGELRAAVRPGPADGTSTVSVVAHDRGGLVADCAGVLAAASFEVLDARVFTSRTGVALDWFVVRERGAAASWERVLGDLAAAAAGTVDVQRAVAARERSRDARPRPLANPVPVTVAVEPRPGMSRIEVSAPDAPGLLYRLASALADADIDLRGARVVTLGPEVRGVFFVRAPQAALVTVLPALRSAAGGVPEASGAVPGGG